MAWWAIWLVVFPIGLAISLIRGIRYSLRSLLLRQPRASANTFISIVIALMLAWIFDVPIEWAINFLKK